MAACMPRARSVLLAASLASASALPTSDPRQGALVTKPLAHESTQGEHSAAAWVHAAPTTTSSTAHAAVNLVGSQDASNGDLIRSLKEEVDQMRKVEERNEKLINEIVRDNKQLKSVNLLAAAPPAAPAGFGSPLDYSAAHAGFMAAIGTLILIPVLIFIGCYVARQVRRANKRYADAKRAKEEQLLREAEEAARPPTPPVVQPPPQPPQRVDANGDLPPVHINPAYLPVDAYHGVPRSIVI